MISYNTKNNHINRWSYRHVRLRGMTYIYTCRSYIHTLCCVFVFYEWHISSVTFTSAHLYANVYMRVGVARALADSSDFGLLGTKVHKLFTALDDDKPALSSAEKSVTIQTHEQ